MDFIEYWFILLIGILCILTFFLLRIDYTCTCRLTAIDVIGRYLSDRIKNNLEYKFESYDEMRIDYNRHLFSIWKWGKYSAIKDEYMEVLKPYMD